jgi:hypothetical protein
MKIFKVSFWLLLLSAYVVGCQTKQAVISEAVKGKNSTIVTSQQDLPVKKDSAYALVLVDRTKKTVYRGIQNPLTIIVPNAVSTKVEGAGVMKVDEFGHYKISPGLGTKAEIKITANMRDGSVFKEVRSFNIRNTPAPKCVLTNTKMTAGTSGISLTDDEIKQAEVAMEMVDFDYDFNFIVTGFEIAFPYDIIIDVEGTKFNGKALDMLSKMKHNTEIKIQNVRTAPLAYGDIVLFRVDPIVIKVNKKAQSKK